MSEKFDFEQDGHMIIKKDRETGNLVSWATIYTIPDHQLENRRFKVIVKVSEDMPVLKQVAKIKMLAIHFNGKDKYIISSAKSNGFVDMGIYRPIEAEKMQIKGKELGLIVELEEVFINDSHNK